MVSPSRYCRSSNIVARHVGLMSLGATHVLNDYVLLVEILNGY